MGYILGGSHVYVLKWGIFWEGGYILGASNIVVEQGWGWVDFGRGGWILETLHIIVESGIYSGRVAWICFKMGYILGGRIDSGSVKYSCRTGVGLGRFWKRGVDSGNFTYNSGKWDIFWEGRMDMF